jgi:hypothetical protein
MEDAMSKYAAPSKLPVRFGLFLLALACAITQPGCTAVATGPLAPGERFEFALIGDMPYEARQEKEFPNVMNEIDAADLAFVAHNGDLWWDGIAWTEKAGGRPPCDDDTFRHRRALAEASRHPFIVTPGDNDWADCHRAKPRAFDPMERLARLRALFFADEYSLGRRKLPLARQSDDPRYARYRENARWSYGGVVFVTLHVIGSNNNLGRTPEMDAEHAERMAANLAWLGRAFDEARRRDSRAVMIIAQANPRFETAWPAAQQQRYMLAGLGIKSPETRRATGFDEFIAELERQTLAFGRPVVYAHGDTHLFRIDKPLYGAASRRVVENFTRVETIGYPDTHWVRAIVDPADPNVFSFRLQIVKENRARH